MIKSVSNMTVVCIYIFCMAVLNCSCNDENANKKYLEDFNEPGSYTLIQNVDSIKNLKAKACCLEISHDSRIDLRVYHLVINIDGNIVYSGGYKPKVMFPFNKTAPFYPMAILLYDT